MRMVSVYEAKTSLSKLLTEVEAGEEVVISRNGRPIARLTPVVQRTEPRVLGDFAGQIWMSEDFDDFTEQDEKDWYGE
ncbi:MAG: type II toxin-antitoxin system prevent-host-death family antitoxin [Pseudolysinimonas sp.]